MKKLYVPFLLCLMVFSPPPPPGHCADKPAQDAPQENTPPPPGRDAPLWQKDNNAQTQPPIRMMQPGLFQMGNITINKNQGLVSAKGHVNMAEGLVEYLACTPKGKLHECILSLDLDPSSLQIALLLAGFEPGTKPLSAQGGKELPTGEKVDLIVSWQNAKGQATQVRAEQLIYDQKDQKTFPQTPWIFTGSTTIDNKFMASVEHSIVAIYHDPYALFDHPLAAGSEDTRFFSNKDLLPAKGTPITFTVKSLRPKDAPNKPPIPPRPDQPPARQQPPPPPPAR